MVSYNVAIILSVDKQINISELQVELCSRVKVFWSTGVPPTKTFNEEFYNLGSTSWNLTADNFDLYIPPHVSTNNQVIANNNSPRTTQLFRNDPLDQRMYLDKTKSKQKFLHRIPMETINVLKPGDYVFILPVIFTNHIPETIYLPSARVSYKIRIGALTLDTHEQKSSDLNLATASTSSSSSASSLKITESESAQPSKGIGNSILKKVKNHLHMPSHINKDEQENKNTNNEIFAEVPIKVIRTPPPISISTANKPIYINRVWTDSLAYEISFAQKYVSLNSEVPIKIKLAPMVKNICIKRIKISITEKVTFVSKNYEFEYDQVDPVAKDPYNPYYLDFASKRKKERNLTLLEVRTKEKGGRALREEIVENSYNDNLLAYTTIDAGSDRDGVNMVSLTEPLTLETKLEFPKYEDLDRRSAKVIPPYGVDLYSNVPNSENVSNENHHRPSVISFLSGHSSMKKGSTEEADEPAGVYDPKFHETKFRTNSGTQVKHHTRINKAKRGLYLDSLHFSNIHSKHKLEIMLRISKPDPDNSQKLRHYEVLIDTPIFLVSELCNSGNMELPTYHMATTGSSVSNETRLTPPPTFEEVISVPGSPIGSPIGSPDLEAQYEADISSIRQLSLSRSDSASSQGGQCDTRSSLTLNSSSTAGQLPLGDGNPRFNNLDVLLCSPSPVHRSNTLPNSGKSKNKDTTALFKEGYTLKGKTENDEISRPTSPPAYEEATKNQ